MWTAAELPMLALFSPEGSEGEGPARQSAGPDEGAQPRDSPEISPQRRGELVRILEYFGLTPQGNIWTRLNQAMIHRSHRAEAGLNEDNERLEFLGDSVIGLACTEHLIRLYPDSDEGSLSKLRATLVSRQVLGRIAVDMELGELLLLGTGEERSGGRERRSILGSALEAVVGAMYLEYAWRELHQAIVEGIIEPALELNEKNQIVDYKSRLQEWTQRELQEVPEYDVIREEGPDHLKEFEVEVRLEEKLLGRGVGRRKKTAENEAARDALAKISKGLAQ